ncbi:MAG: hypothetical protein KTR32_28035 [Granulosicoccus sp.]|nr:hypothetical protein [Granulosicoccus sp.]
MTTIPPIRSLEQLAQLDTCAVSDALDTLGLPGSTVTPQQVAGSIRICGIATTVLLEPGKAPETAQKVHLCARAIDASTTDHIIVIQHPGIDAGGWGGVLSFAAQYKGVKGAILNGPSRDIDEARDLGFPLYATGGITRTARGRLHESATNIPVTIDGVTVSPGDFVIADATGVVFIQAAEIERVLDKAEAITRREQQMIRALKSGKKTVEVLGADYEDLLKN